MRYHICLSLSDLLHSEFFASIDKVLVPESKKNHPPCLWLQWCNPNQAFSPSTGTRLFIIQYHKQKNCPGFILHCHYPNVELQGQKKTQAAHTANFTTSLRKGKLPYSSLTASYLLQFLYSTTSPHSLLRNEVKSLISLIPSRICKVFHGFQILILESVGLEKWFECQGKENRVCLLDFSAFIGFEKAWTEDGRILFGWCIYWILKYILWL